MGKVKKYEDHLTSIYLNLVNFENTKISFEKIKSILEDQNIKFFKNFSLNKEYKKYFKIKKKIMSIKNINKIIKKLTYLKKPENSSILPLPPLEKNEIFVNYKNELKKRQKKETKQKQKKKKQSKKEIKKKQTQKQKKKKK